MSESLPSESPATAERPAATWPPIDVSGLETPFYLYDTAILQARFAELKRLFGRHFGVSFAVKSNPNVELLRRILPHVATLDVSSFGEVERGLAAGCSAGRLTFSGPVKRVREVENAVRLGIGELVVESVAEAGTASDAAVRLGTKQDILIRINPATMPRNFGVNMAGKPSQFGIDEEQIEAAIDAIGAMPGLNLIGFHIFSGTNSLSVDAIAENFAIFITLFRKAAEAAGLAPRKLVFGSGFGVPYHEADRPLDVDGVAARVMPQIDALKADPRFAGTECVLEMGRWLAGPAGWLVTGVVTEKLSRGVALRGCDAGFNNHLAACGMMGSVIRRSWRFANLTNPDGPVSKFTLVGPLCTTIDILASDIDLSEVRVGDVLAIANSGAYGLTASPTRFISHPEPAEYLIDKGQIVDVTESRLNAWTMANPLSRAAATAEA